MKKILIIFTFLFCASHAYSMESKLFDSLLLDLKNGDVDKVETFLTENENEYNKDPEYYVLLLNHVLLKGETRQLMIAKGQPKEGDIGLISQETGEMTGFMGERVTQDHELINKGINKTKSALHYFPERLDIHLGLISVAEKVNNWQMVGDQLIDILRISKEIDNKWAWGSINSIHGDPAEFMVNNVLAKTSTLFYADDKHADIALINTSKALIAHYPELVYGYANLGIYHLAINEYDVAEGYLKQALKIDPDDQIVMGNLQKLEQLRKKE